MIVARWESTGRGYWINLTETKVGQETFWDYDARGSLGYLGS